MGDAKNGAFSVRFDPRTGKNKQHTMTALLRQAVLGRLAGYEDANDADRLRFDTAMRHIVGGRASFCAALCFKTGRGMAALCARVGGYAVRQAQSEPKSARGPVSRALGT